MYVCFPPSRYCIVRAQFCKARWGTRNQTPLKGWVDLASLIKIIQRAQHTPIGPGRRVISLGALRVPRPVAPAPKTFYYINNNAFHARKILFEIKSCFLHRAFGAQGGGGKGLGARVTFSARNCTVTLTGREKWFANFWRRAARHGALGVREACDAALRESWKFGNLINMQSRAERQKTHQGRVAFGTWNALRTDFHYKLLWQKSLATKLNGNCSWRWAKTAQARRFFFPFVNHFSVTLATNQHQKGKF